VDLSEVCFEMFRTVVTPRFWRWKPFFVSLSWESWVCGPSVVLRVSPFRLLESCVDWRGAGSK
jgi:hypothetical protein